MTRNESDLEALRLGWKLGFGDDDEFVDYFFTRYDSEETCIVRRNHAGVIVSQMHYFIFYDCECQSQAAYIYGVTTLSEYRGQGLAADMIREAVATLRDRGVAYAVLIAQEPALREWYKSLGFRLMPHVLEIMGKQDGCNFATEDVSLNKGMYYILDDEVERFTRKIEISYSQYI